MIKKSISDNDNEVKSEKHWIFTANENYWQSLRHKGKAFLKEFHFLIKIDLSEDKNESIDEKFN